MWVQYHGGYNRHRCPEHQGQWDNPGNLVWWCLRFALGLLCQPVFAFGWRLVFPTALGFRLVYRLMLVNLLMLVCSSLRESRLLQAPL